MKFETVIGLEVHVELSTQTKLFCSCKNSFGANPNTLVCPVCLGMPGVLPVVNKEAIEKHIMAALAVGCRIPEHSKFDRKNYFYPDMPKNFQTSQYDLPLALGGSLEINLPDGEKKVIGITRIHLEEDTGKSKHAGETGSIVESDYTLLDYNRAGVPLLEIVSEPDMRTPEEAYQYLNELKKILVWLGVSDCKMEQGSLRCDANISIRPEGQEEFGVKAEIKNMNSFRSVRSALLYEEKRQREVIESGGRIIQETRGWEEDRGITVSMRSKEEAHDYRYFPEPDLPPMVVDKEWIERAKQKLPELPGERKLRFAAEYGLPEYDSGILNLSRSISDFFEEAAKLSGDPKQTSNWLMGDILKYLNQNELEIHETRLKPEALAEMINLIKKDVISGKIGKDLIEELLKNGGNPEEIVEKRGWKQISSGDDLLPVIKQVVDDNPKVLTQYLEGKESVKGFFVGQVMKKTAGKANPALVGKMMDEELERRKNNR
ncbi:MAG: Asp-tRNA(Asn)/Glu-tRNA(Gln) amidotransferase subunit GatB [Firmicutes bacterium]|nr:Asp-tRNA(Asn)/Glu-tRNA(Gln) amidotransferase subunit GatB [Bacillota bacterium]